MRDVDADSRSSTHRTAVTPPPPPAPAAPRAAARLAVPAGVLAAVAGAFAYVGAVDPNEPGHYPACPLLRLTGLYCPGCGGLRSAHAFVHGDLPAALQANAPAVLGYAGFAVLWTVWVVRAARGRPLRIDPAPRHVWAAGALLLVFTIVRNLPFGGWLHP
ncbi:hypothetical protein SUDANB6_04460 [Streptomyces sp. enrichment culture]|uniref:DUF2752 domain-containing protein n=1 Tax=Streptomyces sp. enrichment culture TaxID=1795815 RepID=UPI003F55513F